jgi:aspartyl-tRNA(Asn)/glutamyl-tRNA(Gln) amidotransferase subunit B
MHEYELDRRHATLVAGSAEFFERAVALGADPIVAANWMAGDIAALLREREESLVDSPITPQHVADLARLLSEGSISSAGGKAALARAFETGASIDAIVEAEGLRQVSDAGALESVVDEVVVNNPGPAEQFRNGKEGALNALVGQVMKKTKGSANPQLAADLLRARLSG